MHCKIPPVDLGSPSCSTCLQHVHSLRQIGRFVDDRIHETQAVSQKGVGAIRVVGGFLTDGPPNRSGILGGIVERDECCKHLPSVECLWPLEEGPLTWFPPGFLDRIMLFGCPIVSTTSVTAL